jgi:hypothetical protein
MAQCVNLSPKHASITTTNDGKAKKKAHRPADLHGEPNFPALSLTAHIRVIWFSRSQVHS